MATKTEPDFPSSPPNDESDGEGQELVDEEEQELEDKKPVNNNVADLLKRLQSSGALIKKPKQEYHCFTCDEDFPDWEELENHLITHVQLPSVVVDKLPSDDEDVDIPNSEDEEWSDEDETTPTPNTAPTPKTAPTTPQKLDISQILKKTGLSIKKPSTEPDTSNSALNKLSGLGFTIKKNNSPIKKEPEDEKPSNDVLQRLGKLGGIKLKLKSDGSNSNSFKVVNGLKDFKTSDDEIDDDDEDPKDKSGENESDEEIDKSGENDKSAEDDDSGDEPVNSQPAKKLANTLQNLKGKTIVTKVETVTSPAKPVTIRPVSNAQQQPQQTAKPASRPFMKQTPKRGANLPLPTKDGAHASGPSSISSNSTPERPQSQESMTENVVVKKEVESESQQESSMPLFSGQIKTERTSPPPTEVISTPIVASVKTEPETTYPNETSVSSNQSISTSSNQPIATVPPPLLPVTKTEDTGVTVIEINGDSNDEDDDCCVVSTTPASDVKPLIPKVEPVVYPPPASSQSSYSSYTASSQPSYASSYPSGLPLRGSTEKQHSFDWNAPDSKPPLDMLEKSTDDIFESLLSNATKKENMSLSDASEYVSLDTLGAQHTCEICNTRFTSISLLNDHRRLTGHSSSLVASSSASLLPYQPSSNILQSLLPVKQMVEQVGKLSGMNQPFTHQQNVMINIQAYPGAGGVIVPPQSHYNTFGPQNMGQGHPQSSNMYGAPGQPMHDQFSNQNYMGQQGYGQYPPMPNANVYPGQMPQNSFNSSPYSNASPLQGMQQAVYGQAPTSMNSQMGQMGPPPVPNQYSSPGGSMRPPASGSGVRIQNIQTFTPGQSVGMNAPGSDGANVHGVAPGQVIGGQMPSPGPIRMATGANVTGPRPRMPNIRGQRPTIKPGIQVHGQIRGAKPRMPIKRPANMMPPNPAMKKRPNLMLPRKHDNEDCQVMAMQKQRDGLPLIQSVQGANDKLNLGSGISITKKPAVNREANAMANVLASRGISIKQKQKSRSPSPERPVPHIPNLPAGMSIKHTSKSSNFSIPEAKVGSGMNACKICKKMFMNQNSLAVHMSNAHPHSKVPMFKCEECPASYPKMLQLQHHKRVFHTSMSMNREMGLPVVDISQEENLQRLSSLGIYSFIPLAGREGSAGSFAIPIISAHNAGFNALQALEAEGILSLGPLKSLPKS